MASREKKPLTPAKSKQKSSNNFGSASVDTKPKKSSKSLIKQAILCDIIEAVATNTQLPLKLEASLPRKKAISTLKCKQQKLKVVKSGLLKAKQKVPIKSLKRLNVEVKKTALNKTKKVRVVEETDTTTDECDANGTQVCVSEAEDGVKSAKNNIRASSSKKARSVGAEDEQLPRAKASPKGARKTAESLARVKTQKSLTQKSAKDPRSRKNLIKETPEPLKSDEKCSIDLTIDEVIASMLSDSEESADNARNKKMLVSDGQPALLDESEIKKEILEPEEERSVSDEESMVEQEMSNLKKKPKSGGQRSLRNGKLRQHSDSGIAIDLELNRRRKRLNSDDPASDGIPDTESCFSETSAVEVPNPKEEQQTDSAFEVSAELENNNNGSTNEPGPTLRSKTKTRGSEEGKVEEPKTEDKLFKMEELRNADALRKERILVKLSSEKKYRRNSLNMEMKKAVNAFTPLNKTDETSRIDKMIENIKLTIAKSIENKIFSADKSLLLGKNFEVPKIEEVVAPLSTESQKLGLEEVVDEEKPNSTSTNKKDAEDSVPKVADTAKEIEKLVMGDIEPGNASTDKVDRAEEAIADNDRTLAENKAAEESDPNEVDSENTSKCSSSRKPTSPRKSTKNPLSVEVESKTIEKVPVELSEEGPVENEDKQETIESVEALKKCASPIKFSKTSIKICPENDVGSETVDDVETTDKIIENEAKIEVEVRNEEKTASQLIETPNETEIEADGVKKSPNTRKSLRTLNKILIETGGETELNSKSENEESPKKVGDSVAKTLHSSVEESSLDSTKKNVSPRKSTRTSSRTSLDSTLELETIKKCSRTKNLLKKEDKLETAEYDETGKEEHSNIICSELVEPVVPTLEKEIPEDIETLESISLEVERLVGHVEVMCSDKDDKCDDIEKLALAIDASSSRKLDQDIFDDITKEEVEQVTPMNVDNITLPSTLPIELEVLQNLEDINKDGCDGTHYVEEIQFHKIAVAVETKDEFNEKLEDSSKTKVPTTETVLDVKSSPKKQEDVVAQDKKRVLRARDKQRKNESKVQTEMKSEAKLETKLEEKLEGKLEEEEVEVSLETEEITCETSQTEPQLPRTRRSRELKRRKEEPTSQSSAKVRRTKKDSSRRIEQQNKEETLLDNEVAKINENKANFESRSKNRGDSEPSTQNQDVKSESKEISNRSKSENDIERLNEQIVETKAAIAPVSITKPLDTDDISISGDSSSSLQSLGKEVVTKTEDKPEENLSLKVAMLGMLGLAPLGKIEKQLNQKVKDPYTGTLKTVIKVNPKDRKRSRSPLKMVLKQGRTEGDGESLEFYTIQKELGTSGLGDSSSGANRKITTNHRPLCDEDEEAPPKDRQSLVIPEKSSSFSIHPERLCADVCCYCYGKFGSLDTPMHLAQMKSDDRMKKILVIERHLTKDSCLCDACFRHVDRKAHVSPTNMQSKPQKQHRQLMNTKCAARDCKETAKHNVKRRWLIKIKSCVQNQIDIDWESSQHSSMSFCAIHYPKIERYLTCAICKRRLAKNQTHQLPLTETAELNQRLAQHGVPVNVVPGTFVCKLCRYFTQLQLKYKDFESMSSSTKTFFKNYRKRILHYHNIDVLGEEEATSVPQKEKDVVKDKDKDKDKSHSAAKKASKCISGKQQQSNKNTPSKSPDLPSTSNPPSRKTTPEPVKTSTPLSENVRLPKIASIRDDEPSANTSTPSIQYLTIESTIEKLKKRKAIDAYSSSSSSSQGAAANDVVEILAMDKEVTLTRLPKRPKTMANSNQDITPVVQRLGANPSISVRTLFPGEEEMNLHANIEFNNVREVTPQGWEKCSSVIQYDRDTKLLWQSLQRPYGNQSSFLRHLILLEKYYRAGDLVLAPKASHNALNYSTSVRNRLISYEGPEKVDEPIVEPLLPEYPSPRRAAGYAPAPELRAGPSRVLQLNSGVSIIKKPPPNLQRINAPTGPRKLPVAGGATKQAQGQVFQMSEPEFRKLQTLKKQKQLEKSIPSAFKSKSQQLYKSQQMAQQLQLQKHVRMQQEMLNRQSRGDFEPIVCDARPSVNENCPAQSLLNLNLPKSIQVTTKPSVPAPAIPAMPKIPKSLTVIPQTVTKPSDNK